MLFLFLLFLYPFEIYPSATRGQRANDRMAMNFSPTNPSRRWVRTHAHSTSWIRSPLRHCDSTKPSNRLWQTITLFSDYCRRPLTLTASQPRKNPLQRECSVRDWSSLCAETADYTRIEQVLITGNCVGSEWITGLGQVRRVYGVQVSMIGRIVTLNNTVVTLWRAWVD
jgi:hypothetical protein